MLLNVYTYNGNAINDGTNYTAWFEVGQPAMPSADPFYSARAGTYPLLSTKEIKGTDIVLHIETRGTIHTQLEELKTWFSILDNTKRQLICRDAADGNKQWYVKCTPISPVQVSSDGAGEYTVTLAVDEPLWRRVSVSTGTKNVAASGNSVALSVAGNWYARPTVTLTVTGSKTFGYQKSLWKPWHNPMTVPNVEPLEFTNGGINTATLVADATISNQLNGAITAAETTINVDTAVGGGLPLPGGMCYVGTEQIYYTNISGGGVMTVYDDGAGTTGRGWGGTTAASHADNAVLKKSIVLANGNDIRMFDGRTEIDCWLGGMNSSATKVWIRQRFNPKLQMTLGAALGSGAITTISVAAIPANLASLNRLPSTFTVVIDSEVFFCSNPLPNSYRFTVLARAQKNSVAATHALNATVIYLEHDLTLAYGDALAEDPDRDDLREPIFNLSTSTNVSWVYADFKSNNNLRGAGWSASMTKLSPAADGNSRTYTATQNTVADPASVMGFAVRSWTLSAMLKADTVTGLISCGHPAGFSTVTVTGSKYRLTTDWPVFRFEASVNGGATWTPIFTEATPTTPGAWGALSSHSGVALGAASNQVRWYCSGSVRAVLNNIAALEMTAITLAITAANVLQVAFSTSVDDNYYIDATILVVETGESIRLRGAFKTGSIIVVDCDVETITLNSLEGGISITFNTERTDWLNFPSPAQSATCTLAYYETGVTNVTMDVSWRDRELL